MSNRGRLDSLMKHNFLEELCMRHMVGYCPECGKKTKHRVIECQDSLPYRVFETVFTLGFAAALPHDYECECTRCGTINTLTKG